MYNSKLCYAIWSWGTKTKEGTESAYADVSKIGYTSVENVRHTIDAYNHDAKEFSYLYEKYGVKNESFFFGLPFKGNETEFFETVSKDLEFVAETGTKRITLQGTAGRTNGEMTESEMAHNVKYITKFAKLAKEFDLTVGVHNHVNNYTMYANEIDYVMENTDPSLVHFVPDTGHMAAAGVNPAQFIKKYADRISFTHLKDYKMGESNDLGGWSEEIIPVTRCFHPMGNGIIDCKEILDILIKCGYNNPLCVELDLAHPTHFEGAKSNFDFLKKYFDKE